MKFQMLIVSCVMLFLAASFTFAQDSQNIPSTFPKMIIDRFDSFDTTNLEAEKAHLDNLAIALQSDPIQIGYIIVYAGRRACVGEAQTRAIRMKKYLVEYRGIDWNRVIWKDAGYLEKPSVLLEMQVRGETPYSYSYPKSLPLKDVQLIDCKVKNRRKGRAKSKRAPNNSFNASAN